MIDIAAAMTESLTEIKIAGGLIVGVIVAIKAFDWIKLVIIQREAAYEAEMDNQWRYGGTDEY